MPAPAIAVMHKHAALGCFLPGLLHAVSSILLSAVSHRLPKLHGHVVIATGGTCDQTCWLAEACDILLLFLAQHAAYSHKHLLCTGVQWCGANTRKWVAGPGVAATCNTLLAGTAWVPGSTVDEGVTSIRDGQVCQVSSIHVNACCNS